MSVWIWGSVWLVYAHVHCQKHQSTAVQKASRNCFQEFRILYFVRCRVEAWSLGLGRCSYILNIQDLHCEAVKVVDEVSHEAWSLDIKN